MTGVVQGQRTASTGLQAALSAQLQPVSSPLQAMEEDPGSAAGSDGDDSPRLLHFDIDDDSSPAATPPRKRQVKWAPTPSSPRVAPQVGWHAAHSSARDHSSSSWYFFSSGFETPAGSGPLQDLSSRSRSHFSGLVQWGGTESLLWWAH